MTDRLGQLLTALPPLGLDHSLDQLEPDVWGRITSRDAQIRQGNLRCQLAAAALSLAIGLLWGWSMSSARGLDAQTLYSAYANLGPAARLANGL